MSAARESFERPGDEAAMARVLAAERQAQDALEQSRRAAAHMLHEARGGAKAISARAALRAGAVRAAMEQRLAARLAEIDEQERAALRAGGLAAEEHARLARAVERLAAELCAGEAAA
jgi:hypothetical protein